jgi:hypothetical protein
MTQLIQSLRPDILKPDEEAKRLVAVLEGIE